ncbi:MAG TPA: polysaccharide pyruvyl transferase family protein [Vicinamibacteria bacterium]|nr:polysaccharide pyruvyl transferase family protein [Vicinamibacteria bacterium]
MLTHLPAPSAQGPGRRNLRPPPTITFFGNFGTQNLGNECTLKAIIQNTRRYLPDARLNCVCPEPRDTSRRYGIPAFLMSYRYDPVFTAKASTRRSNPLIRFFRRVLIRIPLEFLEWIKAFRLLKGTNMLIMTGTGMLGGFGILPLDLHYEILKWSLVAKMRGAKVLFVSVGGGPLERPLSRWIVRAAISLADYRSYRDRFSQQYLHSIGFNTSNDFVYPDLVFSFPRSEIPTLPHQNGNRPLIGLGLMDYYGQDCSPEQGINIYRHYIQTLAEFAAWLLSNGYAVRLLIGDLAYDRRARDDAFRILQEKGLLAEPGTIVNASVDSPEELWTQLAQTDMVVATRFHNILLALMLNKPVLALSYHEKVRSLMAGMGLADYCEDVAELEVPRLRQRFGALAANAEAFKSSVKRKAEENRGALDEQYRHIFHDVLDGSASVGNA